MKRKPRGAGLLRVSEPRRVVLSQADVERVAPPPPPPPGPPPNPYPGTYGSGYGAPGYAPPYPGAYSAPFDEPMPPPDPLGGGGRGDLLFYRLEMQNRELRAEVGHLREELRDQRSAPPPEPRSPWLDPATGSKMVPADVLDEMRRSHRTERDALVEEWKGRLESARATWEGERTILRTAQDTALSGANDQIAALKTQLADERAQVTALKGRVRELETESAKAERSAREKQWELDGAVHRLNRARTDARTEGRVGEPAGAARSASPFGHIREAFREFKGLQEELDGLRGAVGGEGAAEPIEPEDEALVSARRWKDTIVEFKDVLRDVFGTEAPGAGGAKPQAQRTVSPEQEGQVREFMGVLERLFETGVSPEAVYRDVGPSVGERALAQAASLTGEQFVRNAYEYLAPESALRQMDGRRWLLALHEAIVAGRSARAA